MIEHSAAYDAAITGDSRLQHVKAVFDLIDPDTVIESISSNDESAYSLTEQVTERAIEPETSQNIATLEPNRWILNGQFSIEPVNKYERIGHVGYESQSLSGDDRYFSLPYPYLEQEVSGMEYLQAVSLWFSEKVFNGIPEDFSIDVWSGDTHVDTKQIYGNTAAMVVVSGLEVNYPTRIRLTVQRWSLPGRRARILRALVGLYEQWDGTLLNMVDIYTEVTFSGLSLPYSTCTLEVFNADHRFDPYAPNSVFKSIEERQALVVSLGLRLEDGSTEWLPGGTYYQQSGGWALKDLAIQWKLLDIIGMLTKRNFVVPNTLPTTLSGWIRAIVSSMGVNFTTRYIVDDDVATTALTATVEGVTDKRCGEMLRWACMATNTWPRQDMATGNLRVGKLETLEGNRITLGNMYTFPSMEANDDIADITFSLDEGEITFPGTNTESEVSLSVKNPFIHTTDDARKAVASCFFAYGGKSFQVRHRGNPSSAMGDIQSVDTQFGTAISARLYKQQLKYDKGVMRNVPSYLVQSPNDSVYTNKILLTGSGTWTAPDEATGIKITLISGGTGGRGGRGGQMKGMSFDPPTEGGTGGDGGKVYITELETNSGQAYAYSCGRGGGGGAGGAISSDGTFGGTGSETTFSVFSSANGRLYPNGLMDIQSGAVYAQKGADNGGTVSGTYGTGGAGGRGGDDGLMHGEEDDEGYVTWFPVSWPTEGKDGEPGKEGCVIIEW